jgi:hypothetical protein
MRTRIVFAGLVIGSSCIFAGCGGGAGALPDLVTTVDAVDTAAEDIETNDPDQITDVADAVPDPLLDVVEDDDTCVSACGARECGDDGCGGLCGQCQPQETCGEGLCVPAGYGYVTIVTLVTSVGPGPDVMNGTGFFDSIVGVPIKLVVVYQPQPESTHHSQMLDSTKCTYLRLKAGKSRVMSGGTALHQSFLDGIVGQDVSVSYCISPGPSSRSSEALSIRTLADENEQSVECTFRGGIIPLSTDADGFPIPIPLDGATGQVDWLRYGKGSIWGMPTILVSDIATGYGLLGLHGCSGCLANNPFGVP